MEESKITSTGQTTNPKSVRKFLSLNVGDKIRYCFEDDKVILMPAKTSIRSLKGSLPKPDKPVSLEDMDKAIINSFRKVFITKSFD